jgi:membrane-bound serine protease (ClpP class)
MTWRQRFLSTLAHPQIAYLLFTLGLLGLTVELWNPGSALPGVTGGVCLLLAFLAFQVLPINVTGLLLIALGVGLLVLEIKFPTFGALGVGGVVSLVLGSIVLMGDTRDLRVGLWLIVPAMLAFGGIFLFLGRLAVASQRQRPVSGAEGMLRVKGQALTDLTPDRVGQVSVRGEIWSAIAPAHVSAGSPVHVVRLRGLTLLVEPDPPAGNEGPPT